MNKPIPYEGRETEEWWWGGKSNQYQHIQEHNPDDEVVEFNEFNELQQ